MDQRTNGKHTVIKEKLEGGRDMTFVGYTTVLSSDYDGWLLGAGHGQTSISWLRFH